MEKKWVVDSSVWIDYLAGNAKGETAREILGAKPVILITGFIVAEVALKFLKQGVPYRGAVLAMRSMSSVIPFDVEAGVLAAELNHSIRGPLNKFSLADAHILALARKNGATVLTCDHDFSGLPDAVVVD